MKNNKFIFFKKGLKHQICILLFNQLLRRHGVVGWQGSSNWRKNGCVFRYSVLNGVAFKTCWWFLSAGMGVQVAVTLHFILSLIQPRSHSSSSFEPLPIPFVCFFSGDPDDIVQLKRRATTTINTLDGWRDIPSLYLLNLVYDVMPSGFVDVVVTELGTLPCTSVPAVLRMRNPETYNIW